MHMRARAHQTRHLHSHNTHHTHTPHRFLQSITDAPILVLAVLYSVGAHGIMTLNDFKSVTGDRATGIRSLPVILGVDRAARLACRVMLLPQLGAVVALLAWGRPLHAALVMALVTVQLVLMHRLLDAPRERAAWYNGTGTTLYVLGMLAAAFAVRDGILP